MASKNNKFIEAKFAVCIFSLFYKRQNTRYSYMNLCHEKLVLYEKRRERCSDEESILTDRHARPATNNFNMNCLNCDFMQQNTVYC